MRDAVKGFTLIELMITVAIVAILATIAVPNYADYVRKSRRNEAREALYRVTGAMEKYLLSQNSYPASIDDLNGTVASHGLVQDGSTWQSPDGNYRFSIIDDTLGLRARAVAQQKQSDDSECETLFLWLDGRRSAFDSSDSDNTATCWPD